MRDVILPDYDRPITQALKLRQLDESLRPVTGDLIQPRPATDG